MLGLQDMSNQEILAKLDYHFRQCEELRANIEEQTRLFRDRDADNQAKIKVLLDRMQALEIELEGAPFQCPVNPFPA